MKLTDAKPGQKVRRPFWDADECLYFDDEGLLHCDCHDPVRVTRLDLEADDYMLFIRARAPHEFDRDLCDLIKSIEDWVTVLEDRPGGVLGPRDVAQALRRAVEKVK